MNVESILNKISLFDRLVVSSGFRRDVVDFQQSIQQPQNQNLVFMKSISEKVQNTLTYFENNSLPSELNHILKSTPSFMAKDFAARLEALDSNKEIDSNVYFQGLNAILTELGAAIDQNVKELKLVREAFSKYISKEQEFQIEEGQALVSLIFKDLKSVSTIKEFYKVLHRWNRTLLVLYQLLKSDPPKDIPLVEIQNGSIDVIFNIDMNVAIDLTDVIKTCLQAYGGYLLYKSKVAEIVLGYLGNRALIEQEAQRETLMLSNIQVAVETKLLELHAERLQQDVAIDNTAVQAKIKEVSSVITDHVIKGNEVKLLTPPSRNNDTEENIAEELRENTALVRERYNRLKPEEKAFLLQKYSIPDDNAE